MKKQILATAVGAVLAANLAVAENLVPEGDFTRVADSLAPLVYNASGPGGRLSLFCEPLTWNRCGKLEVCPTETNRNGHLVYNAIAAIGSEGRKTGFPVTPGKTYDFSLELKGSPLGVGVGVHSWTTDYWQSDCRQEPTSLKGVVVQKDWTLYKGSFKIPEGKTRAALTLQVWQSSQYTNPMTVKPGDYVLFDNVKIEESADTLAALKGGAPRKASVEKVKALALGENTGDFLAYSRGALGGKASVAPRFRVTSDGAAFVIDVGLEREKGIVAGDRKSPWTGDAASRTCATSTCSRRSPATCRRCASSSTRRRRRPSRRCATTRQSPTASANAPPS